MHKWLIGLFSVLWLVNVWATSTVDGVRLWSSPDGSRVVFDISESSSFNYFSLDNPYRVVIDLKDTNFKADIHELPFEKSLIKNIRVGKRAGNICRIVIDLKQELEPTVFSLKPQGEYGHRLVIDLDQKESEKNITQKPTATMTTMVPRNFVIAIDAGHGGEDPGAIGRRYQTKEKDIVLSVAKQLQDLINRQPGMQAFLVRRGDYYVGLRKRMQLARNQNADLFISIHADSFNKPTAAGASVFILSRDGASSEAARWLAERENRADLIGGISLDDKGDILASVLLDLSQTANLSASEKLARNILDELGKVVKLHQPQVQRAGFAVLKSPDVPSILVELGFISNAQQEGNLRTRAHQEKLAQALFAGVKDYLQGKPLPMISQSVQNPRHYKVAFGDTISSIAFKFEVSESSIKALNGLTSDKIYVGQLLKLPKQEDT